MGPPLRPCSQDIAVYEECVKRLADSTGRTSPLRALLLGVTPELALMPLPPDSRILALDRCLAMISIVWPAKEVRRARVVVGDWRDLPVAAGTTDVVLGDGCFTTLSYPDEYHRVASNLHRILSPGGALVLRFFVRPEQREGVREIVGELHNARIQSFHACKLRLAMALHGPTAEEGVCLDAVWRAFQDFGLDSAALTKSLGWTPDVVSAIDAYRGVQSRYTFPTLAEVRRIFAAYFQEEACHPGSYELADRCPLLRFRNTK